jgi:PAS domain S-box-containing protein
VPAEVRLDHLAAIKASQALSGEIMLPRLLERLLTIALETTGAQRCVLALVEEQCPVSAAEAFIADGRVEVNLERPPAALGASLPEALLNYVLRTREALIIDDTELPGPFAHVFHGRPERSALCLPVQSKARLLAVIYFSHDQLTRLFTAERLAFLELLAAQFAISVENARLYGWVIDENRRRTAAEERLALAVSSAELGIWDWDIRTNSLRWDAQMFRIYGLNAQDAATPVRDVTLWESCVHPEDRAQALQDMQAALSGEVTGYDTAFRVRWPDGNVRNIKAYGRVIRGPEGQPIRMLGVNQDVTERIRLEERLAQAEKLSSIGHLASGIAHNLNNQLTCVRGYAEMLLLSPLAEEQRKDAAGIISVSRRAGDLVAQLLAFARKSTLIARPVDMHQLLNETAGMLKHGLDSRIEIELELDAQPPHVLGDATQLQNALLNLGFNARDAMPIGGKLIFATQVEELEGSEGGKLGLAPGRYLRLRVTDTGIGMSAETRRRIFEPFFTTKPVGKGTGLGLASVHGTIAQHRGVIAVESAVNEGTTFTVHLPLLNPERAKPVRSRPPRPGGG